MRISVFITLLFVICFNPAPTTAATIHIPKDYGAIQSGINAAKHGDTVLVAPGFYIENIDFQGKAITVKSSDGAKVTTIDGNQSKGVVTFQSGEREDSVLDGFTIMNGYWGKGVECIWKCSPLITNNIVTKNLQGFDGGIVCGFYSAPLITGNLITGNGRGIYCQDTSAIIFNNIISNNGDGGGVSCFSSSLTLMNNTIINNKGLGGVYVVCSNILIKNNTISNNSGVYGGGISCHETFLEITNNIISRNTAELFGGGVLCYESNLNIINTTFSENSAICSGGGVYSRGSDVDIVNSIFWINKASYGPSIFLLHSPKKSSILKISYSNVFGGAHTVFTVPGSTVNWGSGVIHNNPRFIDPDGGDFHLSHISPCKDAGNNHANSETTDFENDPRIFNGTIDMGADEFHTHLYSTGVPAPGGQLTLHFIDNPQTKPVILWLGSGVLKNPITLPPHGDWFLQFPILLHASLGSIPGPNGVLNFPSSIPSNLPTPLVLPLQAGIGNHLTNLLEILIQ